MELLKLFVQFWGTFLCVCGKEEMKQDLHKTKEIETLLQYSQSLWVCSNLSMPKLRKIDIIHILSHNFWTTSQNFTKLGTDILETLYFTPA